MGYDVNSKVWSWSDFRFWIISKNYKYSVLTLVVKIFTFSNWKFNKCWLILARQLLCKKYQRTSCKRRLTHFKRELVVVVGWLCLKHTATVVWLSGDSCLAWHTRAELQQRHQNWAQPGHHLTGHHNKTIKKPPNWSAWFLTWFSFSSGRYIDEKLSKTDKSAFLKLSATYRYQKMEILKLSKNYRYRKMHQILADK